jgi:hypothetical protein
MPVWISFAQRREKPLQRRKASISDVVVDQIGRRQASSLKSHTPRAKAAIDLLRIEWMFEGMRPAGRRTTNKAA